MKKIVFIFIACFTALAISSCNQQMLENKQLDFSGGLDGLDGSELSPYFFSFILKPKELKLLPSTGNFHSFEASEFTSLHFLLSGDAYGQFKEATFDEFKKLANKIGDTENKEGYLHATVNDHNTTESAISDVMIKSLSRYNETHPEGSSLKDLIRITYHSYDFVFDKTLKPTIRGGNNQAVYSLDAPDDVIQVKYPALIAGRHGAQGYRDGLFMTIEFLQAPSIPTQQIQVTILFENGMELTKDITFDILKIEE